MNSTRYFVRALAVAALALTASAKTYRWRGHWTGDPEVYRTREEVEDWKQNKDPIKRFREYLIKHKLATKKELDEIDAAAAEKMAKAVEFAMNSPEPDPAHVLDDVFYEG